MKEKIQKPLKKLKGRGFSAVAQYASMWGEIDKEEDERDLCVTITKVDARRREAILHC